MKTTHLFCLAVAILLMAQQAYAQFGTTISPDGIENYDDEVPPVGGILWGTDTTLILRDFDTVLLEADPSTGISTSAELEDEYGFVSCKQLDSICDTCDFETLAFIRDCSGVWDKIVTKRDMIPFTGGTVNLGNPVRRFNNIFSVNTYAENFISTSDKRFKQDIRPLAYGLKAVNRLEPVAYQWKSNPSIHTFGFLAQDVQKIFPELVHESEGRLGLNYDGFIPLLTQAVQEMDAYYKVELAEKENRIAALEHRLNELEQERGAVQVQAGNQHALGQNVPNPFSDETVISYSIRSNASKAILTVHSATTGQLAREITLNPEAKKLTLSTRDLEAGAYIYSLTVDGTTIDSKIMIVQSQNR